MKRLLIIEDFLEFVDHLRLMLRDHGWSVLHASNLADGLSLLRHDTFDAVLLDLGLPDSPARETVGRLAEIRRLAWPGKLVVVTGQMDVTDIPQGSADALLPKGAEFAWDSLLAAIGGRG